MIDFHSHVLPGIDDGADCVETSLEMLRESKKQGVTDVVATPHFYSDEMSVGSFLRHRQEAYETLCKAMKDEELPKIHLGCEVHLDGKMHKMEKLDQLCLEGTNIIMLEMPFDLWQPWLNDVVYHIRASRRLIPIIAHVDRYQSMLKQFQRMEALLSMEVIVQLNADSFLNWRMKRSLQKIIGLNRPIILGSDMHNMDIRQTRMEPASKKIEKKFGAQMLRKMESNAAQLLENRLSF